LEIHEIHLPSQDKNGEIRAGSVEAATAETAAELLRHDGLFVTFLRKDEEKLRHKLHFLRGFQERISRFFRASWR